jgi:RNA polymerase sigma-70 factor (ECF subfamily)
MSTPSHEQKVLQLFVSHQSQIKGFILALLPDFAAAEDVLQETFLVVQRKASEFDLTTSFTAWAFRIAKFQVMKAQTAYRRKAERFSDATLEALAECAPADLFEDRRLSVLPACLAQLAPQARKIMDLFYGEEHKPREIAARLGWSAGAVSVALSRSRKMLRECIQSKITPSVP